VNDGYIWREALWQASFHSLLPFSPYSLLAHHPGQPPANTSAVEQEYSCPANNYLPSTDSGYSLYNHAWLGKATQLKAEQRGSAPSKTSQDESMLHYCHTSARRRVAAIFSLCRSPTLLPMVGHKKAAARSPSRSGVQAKLPRWNAYLSKCVQALAKVSVSLFLANGSKLSLTLCLSKISSPRVTGNGGSAKFPTLSVVLTCLTWESWYNHQSGGEEASEVAQHGTFTFLS
jgi:hypothetical protein